MSDLVASAVADLNALNHTDPEWAHGEAEEIVLRFLRDSGGGDVAAAFEEARERVGFWYA